MRHPQLASPPTELWKVYDRQWRVTPARYAAQMADLEMDVRLVTLCRRCGRDMADVPGDKGAQNGGTVNVDANNLPWCGCPR